MVKVNPSEPGKVAAVKGDLFPLAKEPFPDVKSEGPESSPEETGDRNRIGRLEEANWLS